MSSVQDLTGKTAVVTGGGRGIGKAIALALADAGADVAVVARTYTEIGEVAETIRGKGRKGIPVTADLTDPGNVDSAINVIKFEFGQVDILVNNAGGATDRSSMEKSSREDWLGAVRLNIDSVYMMTLGLLPLMVKGSKIINVGSGMGHASGNANSSYRVGKAGAWMLTQCMAEEFWDKGIDVNELVPGPVLTDATKDVMEVGGPPPFAPSERVKTPEEVVPLAMWLARQKIGGPTGQSFSLARRPL
ncbi:SDR family NAD(P)-dependent oxidoreductase [Candidatus Lucifugimonas marina]|uniref:SDR family NAD(P)-dependent oxidoreductase n=1 Tax=Candidatus Lucifugimonas marina TaxID=3038979 RepID=A0AAJ5ZEM9_9CHLR|nr:SDR family NAD(P)-dependent oxidoreductase [SAR202 cluster bacterium JH702]MDG0870705.1 SDR family NAD(P)-dependent oxidoreductase [SAR202 cluster bacterium JH639]WFG34789.1 SDR family NAD(P)-dependent oxidoreductase [SAR202 cluster bacterium JH545]WFG38729.1 SDR family NAD(P)-dependent oxidoreductase [SAR202 cluster bacterium JH1073]